MDNGSSGRLVNHEEGRGRGSRISRTAAGPSRGGVYELRDAQKALRALWCPRIAVFEEFCDLGGEGEFD